MTDYSELNTSVHVPEQVCMVGLVHEVLGLCLEV